MALIASGAEGASRNDIQMAAVAPGGDIVIIICALYLFTFACTYTCTPYVELLYMLKLPLVNDLLTGKLTTSTKYIAGEAYSYRR